MQVYRELRILTSRPSTTDEIDIPHRLYGCVSGASHYSVGHWLDAVSFEINDVWNSGQLPIIVGGTGLYFMALEKGLAKIPSIDPVIRDKWRKFQGDLHHQLATRHPESANHLDPADRQRLVRALEVYDGTGLPLVHWQKIAQEQSLLFGVNVERKYLNVSRSELYYRADQRFNLMMEQGALEEVRIFPKLDTQMPIMKAIGMPQLQAYYNGQLTLDEAVAAGKLATRQYIKRQSTWSRGQMKDWPVAH